MMVKCAFECAFEKCREESTREYRISVCDECAKKLDEALKEGEQMKLRDLSYEEIDRRIREVIDTAELSDDDRIRSLSDGFTGAMQEVKAVLRKEEKEDKEDE